MNLETKLDPIKVQAIPSAHNSLAWSEDGDLALAAGEHVHIFTPKRQSSRNDAAAPLTGYRQWDSCRVKMNAFTELEWPSVAPRSFADFSIGNEQSVNTVSSLAWSPNGLATHRRSFLAVHTTNLVLSLWETNGEVGKWTRVCTVNQWLPQATEASPKAACKTPRGNPHRITAFSWSPRYSSHDPNHHFRWGTVYLAVVTDDHNLFILEIAKDEGAWNDRQRSIGNVVKTINLGPIQQPFATGSLEPHSLFAEYMIRRSVETDVSWSPCVHRDSTSSSFVAVSRGNDIELLHLTSELIEPFEAVENGSASEHMLRTITLSGRITISGCTGPFSWNDHPVGLTSLGKSAFDKMSDGSACLSLLATTNQSPLILAISEQGHCVGRILLQTDQHDTNVRDDFHNSLCMFTWEKNHTDQNHFSYQGGQIYLASLYGRHRFLSYSARGMNVSKPKNVEWSDDIEEAKRSYALQYGLGDAVELRIHGMVSIGQRTAICFRFRPSDMIEYALPATTISHVLFHAEGGSESHPTEEQTKRDKMDVLRGILDWIMQRLYKMKDSKVSQTDRKLAWTQFRILLSTTSDETSYFPYQEMLSKIEHGQRAFLDFPTSNEGDLPGDAVEICEICQSPLDVDSIEEAMCINGHAFSRCSLSLFAIQEPGISKECSLCSRQYLDLFKVQQHGAMTANLVSTTAEPDVGKPTDFPASSTIRQLFETYDICPYCEGKFCG